MGAGPCFIGNPGEIKDNLGSDKIPGRQPGEPGGLQQPVYCVQWRRLYSTVQYSTVQYMCTVLRVRGGRAEGGAGAEGWQ